MTHVYDNNSTYDIPYSYKDESGKPILTSKDLLDVIQATQALAIIMTDFVNEPRTQDHINRKIQEVGTDGLKQILTSEYIEARGSLAITLPEDYTITDTHVTVRSPWIIGRMLHPDIVQAFIPQLQESVKNDVEWHEDG